MSLQIFVRQFARVPLKGDKVAKVTFRGVSLFTRVVEEEGDDVLFDEILEWPMGRPLDPNEVVDIQLQIYNRYFSNKVAASYGLVLHRLVSEGHIAITDHMTDTNNKVIKTRLAFEARYTSPANKKLEQTRRAEGSRGTSSARGGEGGHGEVVGGQGSHDSSDCDEGRRTRDSSIDSFSRENEKESLIRGRTNSGFFSSTTKRLSSFTSEKKRSGTIDSGRSAPPTELTKPSVRHSDRSKSSKGDSLSRKSRRDSTASKKRVGSVGRANTEEEGQPVASTAATGGQVRLQKLERERDKPTQSKSLLDNNENDSSDDQGELQFPVSGRSETEPVSTTGQNEDNDVVPQSRKASSVRATDSDQDEKQMLLNVEQNIANLEKSMSMQERISSCSTKNRSKDSSPDTPRKSRGFSTGMKAVRSLVRLGRQRSRSAGNTTDDEEKCPLQPSGHDTQASEGFVQPPSRPHSVCSTQSENDSSASAAPAAQPAKKQVLLMCDLISS
ncbi:hypothetical protein FHG87_000816 [Trinorchestia longiramus]|nr:hypothetical protein FHG87_000816 [Trinorchestia longiramus]